MNDAAPPSLTFASGGLSWTRVRLPRQLSRAGKALLLAGVLAVGIAAIPPLVMVGVVLRTATSLYVFFFLASYILSLSQSVFPGSLVIAPNLLTITPDKGRPRLIPIEQIVGALVVEREMFGGYVPTIEIELADGDILTVRLADSRAAQTVVRKLGFGPGGRRLVASLGKPTRRLIHVPIGIFLQTFVGGVLALAIELALRNQPHELVLVASALPVVFVLALYTLIRRWLQPPRVTVGEDGVLVERRGRRTFIRRNQAPGKELSGVLLDHGRRAAVANLIAERHGGPVVANERAANYDRMNRPVAVWRQDLAKAFDNASYRVSPATIDDASAVLQSPVATPEQRIGAALAMRAAGAPPERLRVALEASADDRTREALRCVIEAEDDAPLEKALLKLRK